METLQLVPWGIVVAAIGGLAIGIEREWSGHATGPAARFGGVRTFTMLGALGGIAGWLWSAGSGAFGVVLLAAACSLVIAAYIAASRGDVEGTTEVAALIVLAAGTLAGLGYLALASGIIAVSGVILLEKSQLHAFVGRIDDEELRAAMRFAVMAVVILPLLPVGPYGPMDVVKPRELWLFVLFFSGLSFAGYIARKVAGAKQGYTLAGALGGLISSTTVTLTFARASRDAAGLEKSLAYGVIAACTVLFIRVAIAVSVLNPALIRELAAYLALPFLVGATIVLMGLRSIGPAREQDEAPRNPLQFRTALKMAVIFQIVLAAITVINRHWGDMGITVAGALLGLADVDALTLSMARQAGSGIPPSVAVHAIVMGTLTDALLKLTLAAIIGRGVFRRVVVAGIAALALAIGVSLIAGTWW